MSLKGWVEGNKYAIAGSVVPVLGTGVGYMFDSAEKAEDAQSQAAAQAGAAQAAMSEKQLELQRENLAFQKKKYEEQQTNLQPWLEAGQRGLKDLEAMPDFSYNFNKPSWQEPTYRDVTAFNAPDFDPTKVIDMYRDPGYEWRMKEGINAMDRSASAKGGMFGGAQRKALMEYGQGMGSREYQNAYQRAMAEWQRKYGVESDRYNRDYMVSGDEYRRNYGAAADRYNRDYGAELDAYNRAFTGYNSALGRRQSMAGIGQSATAQSNAALGGAASAYGMGTNQMAQIYGQQGQNLANMYLNQGNAAANKYTTQANIVGGMVNTGISGGMMLMGA